MSSAAPSGLRFGTGSYRGVLLIVLVASALGGLLLGITGFVLDNPVVVDAAVTLALSASVLLAVERTQHRRELPHASPAITAASEPTAASESNPPGSRRDPKDEFAWLLERFERPQGIIAALGGAATAAVLFASWNPTPGLPAAAAAASVPLLGAGLVATAVSYLAAVDASRFPEGPALARGGRLLAWVLVSAALALGLAWVGSLNGVRWLHFLILALNALICFELFVAESPAAPASMPTDLHTFSALGSRTNPLASLGDAAQQQLGIDLRSTWALDVVRRSIEPLLVALVALGWLCTGLTVVGVEEQGLVERLGVPLAGAPLDPGLHVHWPWPIDRVVRIPVRRIQMVTVGHEGEEEPGPEDVLWARQHGKAEYTLLLGDGRDLIAIDAGVRFRISDPAAWRYRTQNPADALRAIAYRAVMKSTVGLTLAQALSENVVTLTGQMHSRVQADADALGLGVEIVGFTLGGMHPPVNVAADYQAVVSAALDQTTSAITAQAYRNEIVPAAQAGVVTRQNAARADRAMALAKASGEAWSFQALQAEVRAAPEEYHFRRRLETLEKGLFGLRFTVLDARIQRDGGELWLSK